jgi:mono/diheme cytochrome c family protein
MVHESSRRHNKNLNLKHTKTPNTMSVKKIAATIVVLLVMSVIALGFYFNAAYPAVDPAPDIQVEITPENVERGRYLAHHVTVCMDCHSSREWELYSGPLLHGTLGMGGEHFPREMGFPGDFYAPNLTPYHLANWTDGELYRAITAGVSKDGRALFPVMPYPAFGKMAKEDIYAIIAYLRSLPAQESEVPTSKADFPFNLILKTLPQMPTHASAIPDKTNKIAYGAYLFSAASCMDCHTPYEKGKFDMSLANAGGRAFPMPSGIIRTPNITPHPSTGIGLWTEEQFVGRFKAYADSHYVPARIGPEDFQTIMPWTMYGGMEEEDLRAIFAYLQSLPPVEHSVERFSPLALK